MSYVATSAYGLHVRGFVIDGAEPERDCPGWGDELDQWSIDGVADAEVLRENLVGEGDDLEEWAATVSDDDDVEEPIYSRLVGVLGGWIEDAIMEAREPRKPRR